MQTKRVNLSITGRADEILDTLAGELHRELGPRRGGRAAESGGWRSAIVSALVERATTEEVRALLAERKAA